MFTANIVERFSHPNKIEAQERRRGGVYPKLESPAGLTAGVTQCPSPGQLGAALAGQLWRWAAHRRAGGVGPPNPHKLGARSSGSIRL